MSQSFQESFVLNATKEKREGFYIEIGSNHPFFFSNTMLLETRFGWNGLAFDMSKNLVDMYNFYRKNLAICADATSIDYYSLFEKQNCPVEMDYLQLDIEPAAQTLSALKKLPLETFRFRVVTFEHDLYADPLNIEIQKEAFDTLSHYGYTRVIKNIASNGNCYEDWYVHSDLIDQDFLSEWQTDLEKSEDKEIFLASTLA